MRHAIISSMQPNGPAPPPPQQNPYDYLLNPAVAPKKSTAFGGGKPNKLVMVLFVLGILVLVIVAYSVFSSLTKKSYTSVIDLAERQNEIVRISELGIAKAHDPATLIYVSTIRNVTYSERTATLAFLAKKNNALSPKQLVLKQDSSIDKALTTAEQDNTYDQTLLEKLNVLIASYQRAEKNVTDYSGSTSETALIKSLLANAKVINGLKS